MPGDYTTETVHGEVVKGGDIGTSDKGKIDVKTLRDCIPAHCLQPSTLRSFGWVAHDLSIFLALLAGTLYLEQYVGGWSLFIVRYFLFPYAAGICLTGLWVLGHEAGHGAFSTNKTIANSVGFVIHSALMSPYFAWRSSHGRHHQYANNMSVDLNYVPPMRDEYKIMFSRGENEAWDELMEDTPVVVFLRILLQQVIGWPWYLLSHITAGPNSSPKQSRGWWDNSHFLPNSSLFRADEFWNIVASDVGLIAMGAAVYKLGQTFGFQTLLWTYILPLMWVNHWIVMITYLHHTHTSLPKYTPESWTYLRGALATVDRDPGWLLRYMMHHIIDLHVVHHLFPRIPHYHAKEATEAIKPLLGDYYHTDKSSYWGSLWTAFTECQWVEPDPIKTLRANVYTKRDDGEGIFKISEVDEKGVLWYRSGRMPPPVVRMRL
ncbi:delta-12 fatty acid desaturas-like protein [Biscogniauxia sp. FL1348]|nr:delta-12 fatty acid desaturas-like protein [Biscogniauxia sp. FL1348]